MQFKLFEELGKLGTGGILLLIAGVVVAIGLIVALVSMHRREAAEPASTQSSRKKTRALVYGALCLSLSFVLSYLKVFEMPMGGSITLFSMLPLTMYAAAFGPVYGFTAAFAYSLLQVAQGAYVIHWAQFLLDYILAFTCMGLASLFPKSLPLGIAVSGLARLACSVLSGVIFFSSYAIEAGYQSAWLYSIAYNGSSLGVDTLLCVLAAFLPAVKQLFARMKTAV